LSIYLIILLKLKQTAWYTDTAHDVKENSVETGTEIIPETHCMCWLLWWQKSVSNLKLHGLSLFVRFCCGRHRHSIIIEPIGRSVIWPRKVTWLDLRQSWQCVFVLSSSVDYISATD